MRVICRGRLCETERSHACQREGDVRGAECCVRCRERAVCPWMPPVVAFLLCFASRAQCEMTNYGSGMITGRIGHSGIAFMHALHPRHRSHQVASSQDRPNVVATGCGDGQGRQWKQTWEHMPERSGSQDSRIHSDLLQHLVFF